MKADEDKSGQEAIMAPWPWVRKKAQRIVDEYENKGAMSVYRPPDSLYWGNFKGSHVLIETGTETGIVFSSCFQVLVQDFL